MALSKEEIGLVIDSIRRWPEGVEGTNYVSHKPSRTPDDLVNDPREELAEYG